MQTIIPATKLTSVAKTSYRSARTADYEERARLTLSNHGGRYAPSKHGDRRRGPLKAKIRSADFAGEEKRGWIGSSPRSRLVSVRASIKHRRRTETIAMTFTGVLALDEGRGAASRGAKVGRQPDGTRLHSYSRGFDYLPATSSAHHAIELFFSFPFGGKFFSGDLLCFCEPSVRSGSNFIDFGFFFLQVDE